VLRTQASCVKVEKEGPVKVGNCPFASTRAARRCVPVSPAPSAEMCLYLCTAILAQTLSASKTENTENTNVLLIPFGIGELKLGMVGIPPPLCLSRIVTCIKSLLAMPSLLTCPAQSTISIIFHVLQPLATVMRLSGASAACLPL